jgi:hypothetical protein
MRSPDSSFATVSFASTSFLACFLIDVSLVTPGTRPRRGHSSPS